MDIKNLGREIAKTNLINTNFISNNKRLEIPGLVESILGGLAYLADTQVDNNKTYISKTHNFFISAKSKKILSRITFEVVVNIMN